MIKYITAIVWALILASCATMHPTYTNQVDRDSTYIVRHNLDSLYRAIFSRDSIYQRDSIYVYVKGDTVTRYVEKTLYKLQTRRDTVYRDRVHVDTLYMDRVDSMHVEKPVYIEKQIKWYNQGFIWLGRLCCISFILWILFLYLKRKF